MNKKIRSKIEDIHKIVKDRHLVECEFEDEWISHYESLLRLIETITEELLDDK